MRIQFGAVSVQQVRDALDTNKEFIVTEDGKQKVCKLSGPFKENNWGLGQKELRQMAKSNKVTGLDPNKPLELFFLGFRYFQDPDPNFRNQVSHGAVFVQDGQVPQLDIKA